mgnify:CR=1 FL=1|tara:strand:- start:39799 stop:40053 length:255 start_codon:yes stop_codon:yes gene_type:complete
MNTKLTLSLDKSIIDEAKLYAKEQHTSLSKLISNYLTVLIKKDEVKTDELEISPLVKSLVGVISLDDDVDIKKEYQEYLINKYK